MDLLTKAEFEAGFGSHTPMFSGQTKCVRYYMNFKRGLALFKATCLKVHTLYPSPLDCTLASGLIAVSPGVSPVCCVAGHSSHSRLETSWKAVSVPGCKVAQLSPPGQPSCPI